MHWAYVDGAINPPGGSMRLLIFEPGTPVGYGKGLMGGADPYCCT